jgi:hypothetical protein
MLIAAAEAAPAGARGGMEFRATGPRDAAALRSFLRGALDLPADSPIVDDDHMHWKYWAPRDDWTGSRSFVIRRGTAIVAHGAAWPIGVRIGDRVVRGAHVIDWAADRASPGAGIWLMRRIRAQVDLLVATGGRRVTQAILPALGFVTCGEVCTFARPIRPFALAATTGGKGWRVAARLLRNSAWTLREPLSMPRGWSAAPIDPLDVPDALWPRSSPALATAARDAAGYRYYAGATGTPHALWSVRRRGEMVGYFCLARALRIARIADVWLASTSVDDWTAAYRTAAAAAARARQVCEVSAWASTALGKTALARAGFRPRDRAPLSVLAAPGTLGGRELHLQMLDCDASVLAAQPGVYLT